MDSDILLIKNPVTLFNEKVVLFNEFHPAKFSISSVDITGHPISGNHVSGMGIQAAMMISEPHQAIMKSFLEYYLNRNFINSDGTYDTGIISPGVFAKIAERFGYVYKNLKQQIDGITVYPSSYVVCNWDDCCEETVAVHLCTHSWVNSAPKFVKYLRIVCSKFRRTKLFCREIVKGTRIT